ncbi:MAG: nucleotidyltransferase family protein [Ruminococcus sp.]|nr:nucleotidyltransferase family protein [Ruminococcus sp.]
MKISGMVCEYNPFHNGHLHHIMETRKNGATHIVAVMSGNFVQRGDVAIMDKHTRAKLAVRSGVDLVIELPVQFCLSSAENFAAGAIYLLNSLGAVEELSFGSECGDVGLLLKALDTVEMTAVSKASVIRSIMEKGYTFPKALNSVINGTDPEIAYLITQPNNMLAIEYLRALKKLASPIEPFTVARKSAQHDSSQPVDGFASASFIRENIMKRSGGFRIDRYTPKLWADTIKNDISAGRIASLKNLERVILYKLRNTSPQEIASVNDVGQGLEYRIFNSRNASSFEELIYTVKTKRYTMARIKRIMLSLLIGIHKEDMNCMPPYGRILAFNDRGREILAYAKNYASIPYAASIAKLSHLSETAGKFAELEEKASDVYGLALDAIGSAQDDIRAKIMLDME